MRASISSVRLRTVTPTKRAMHSARGMSHPLSARQSRSTRMVIGSLSTSTPSQSKRMAWKGMAHCRANAPAARR